MERRIWMFPQYTAAMADALRLRSALLPYTYTAAADAAERTSIATMHPMYYEWPTEPLAYNLSSTQYLFRPALLASPISNSSGAAMNWSTWLPPLQQQPPPR
jgi:alpha-glucosidase